MGIVIEITFYGTVPEIHFGIIGDIVIRIGAIYSKQHTKKIFRVFIKYIVKMLTVVKIFKNIGLHAVGVVIGINKIHNSAGKNFKQKNTGNEFTGNKR